MEKCVEKGEFRFDYLKDADSSKHDLRLGRMGANIYFELLSPQSLAEFNRLVPDKVDRHTSKVGIQFAPLFPEAIALKRTGKMYKTRRQIYLKLLGFNYASKFIPTMIDVMKDKINEWKEGDTIDALKELGDVALKIIVRITFGKDINSRIRPMKYTHKDGTVEEMDFYHFFPKIMHDLLVAQFAPMNNVFPILFEKGWLYPNNINRKNGEECRKVLKEFLSKLEDKDSVYWKLTNEHGFTQEEIFDDLIGLLHAAHQTSHHTVCSALYFIKKHPQWYKKLVDELEEVGVKSGCNFYEKMTKDVVHDSQNLAYIVKETLRFDPAGTKSLRYMANEDIEV